MHPLPHTYTWIVRERVQNIISLDEISRGIRNEYNNNSNNNKIRWILSFDVESAPHWAICAAYK